MKRPLLICTLLFALVMSPALASAAMLTDFQSPYFHLDNDAIFYSNDFATTIVEFVISDSAGITFGGNPPYAFTFIPDLGATVQNWSYAIDPLQQTLTYTSTTGSVPENLGYFGFYISDGSSGGDLGAFDFTLSWTEYPFMEGENHTGSVTFVDGIPTPLPASLWMLLSGLGLLLGLRRHRVD